MTSILFPSQERANVMLGNAATHSMLYGGAGSGKTVVLTRATLLRAMGVKETSHLILRYRFNHLKASIINDTLPFIMKTEFPDVKWELNKSDWFVKFPWNDSLVYFGGLDDKERTEKILGQGHSTMYLNECSQISYASKQKAITRLRQNRGLRLRMYYDCNPPPQGHWTYRQFVKGIDPIKGVPLSKSMLATQQYMMLHPRDNPNLPADYLIMLQNLSGKDKLRFWDGEFVPAVDSALWTYELIESVHLPDDFILPIMHRIVVAVDPSGCHGPDDKRSDEIGIVVVGLGNDGRAYVLEDLSGRYGPGGEEGWGAVVVRAYKKWRADMVVGEQNFGGAMVENTVRMVDRNVPFKEVHASRGKSVRAEPVSALYMKHMVYHRVPFPELEEQLCNFATNGYMGERSPDRADAMVWGVSELLVGDMPGMGLLEYYEAQAAGLPKTEPPPAFGWQMPKNQEQDVTLIHDTEELVTLMRPANGPSVVYGMNGQKYVVGSDGLVHVYPDDAIPLMRGGFLKQERGVTQ